MFYRPEQNMRNFISRGCVNRCLAYCIILSLPLFGSALSFAEMQRKPAKSIFYHTLTKALCESISKFGKTKQIQPPLDKEPDDHKQDPCYLIYWRICKPGSECSKFEKGDCPLEGTSRIVGGTDAIPHEFPFMIRISLYKPNHCGGAIIAPSLFLTAAHCIVRSNHLHMKVYAGDHNIKVQEPSEQIRNIIDAQTPWSFDLKSQKHDICIVKVDRPFDLNKLVSIVDLPHPNWVQDSANRPFVIGWGIREWRFATGPDILQKVNVPYLHNLFCEKTFYDGKGLYFGPDMFCAGDSGKDSCNNDSGGPAVEKYPNGTFYIVGIVAFGGQCGSVPGAYTLVRSFLGWIANVKQTLQ